MEKPHIEIPKTPFHRKSHLYSETYRALVRILSQCYKHPELCDPTRPVPQELTPDNRCNELVEASEKDGPEQIELVTQTSVSVNENFDSVAFQDSGFNDTQVVINETENFMRIEEDEDPSKQEDLALHDDTNGTGLQDQRFGQLQQLLMDELEHVMKGNEEIVGDKNCNSATISLDENQSDEAVALSNNQEEHLDLQPIVMEECRSAGQQEVDEEHASQNTLETVDLSLGKSMTGDVSNLSDNEDKSSLLRTNELGANHEMQQKEMGSRKSIRASGAVDSPNHIIEDGETEEGEISVEFEVNERLVDVFSEEVAVSQEQKKQLSEDNIGKNELSFNDKKEKTKKDSGSISIALVMVDNLTDRREVQAKEFRNEMVHKRKIVVYGDPLLAEERVGSENKKQKKGCESKEPKKGSRAKEKDKSNAGCPVVCSNNFALSAKKSDQKASGSQGITLKYKQDAGVSNKRKRGPPSEGNKAKKKEKKRKKRAEKNRELGVKRLKLRPVQNPKPVKYCRHYIKGRCQEGEKCKFSHDTIPLTKSKPCCHFARHSCLKGDDCPFDHQLSKYPCSNYVTTGSCSRGEVCMFSHKLPLKEDLPSTSNVCTPDPKPPSLPGTSNSKKQLHSGRTSHHTTKASPDTLGIISHKNTQQNVDKSVLSLPVLVPKGISFLSAGKLSVIESSHSTPGGSSMTRSEGVKAGSQTDQSASGTIQTSNEIPKGTPAAVAPKGINFLSFGKAPLEFSSTKKLASNSGVKLSLSNNFSMIKQSTSPLNMGNSIQAGKETSQSVPNTTPWLNKMRQKTEFAAATPKSNILSLGESSTDGSRSISLGSFPSSSAMCFDRSVQASEIALDKHENCSAIPQGQSVSPLGSGQSANYLAHACLKNTPNSAPKALVSTLAFAAKVESEMKMKQAPIDALAVSRRVDMETGMTRGSQNGSAKASKILDFLSSIGGKMQQ